MRVPQARAELGRQEPTVVVAAQQAGGGEVAHEPRQRVRVDTHLVGEFGCGARPVQPVREAQRRSDPDRHRRHQIGHGGQRLGLPVAHHSTLRPGHRPRTMRPLAANPAGPRRPRRECWAYA
jgi:hypothetical protein